MIEFLKFGASWVLPPGIFFVYFIIAYCCKKENKQTSNSYYICYIYFYLASTSYVASMLIGRLEDAYDPPNIYLMQM